MPSAPRRLSVFGSTGSIGVSTLDVVAAMPGAFTVEVLTGAGNVALLAEQARRCRARLAVTANESRLPELRARLAGTDIQAAGGRAALVEAAARPADVVMAAIVGVAGLEPTLAALRAGATIALANKECLVAAGDLLMGEAARFGRPILPVDSEHSAVFQIIAAARVPERVILTASGGPFRTLTRADMAGVTPERAAGHPNWSMGQRISIDSASMFNKALEMIEARHLFDLAPERIEVVVHPQSIVHALVGCPDGSVLAQMGVPDMRTAISLALAWPERAALPVERLDLARLGRLDFEAPDETRFPALRLAREALVAGGTAGAVLNGAKEAALDAFLARRIGFLDMAEVVERAMAAVPPGPAPASLEEAVAADGAARRAARTAIRALS